VPVSKALLFGASGAMPEIVKWFAEHPPKDVIA
jgi:hypothetical protein